MDCLAVRGLLSGWSGLHLPTYTEAQLAANTTPTTSWTLAVFAGNCTGYAIGYGQVFMNKGVGQIDYSNPAASAQLDHLKKMVSLASNFGLGSRFLVVSDGDANNIANTNNSVACWGQMLSFLQDEGYSYVSTTFLGLDSGELSYSFDTSYFKQFRGLIFLLEGTTTASDDLLSCMTKAMGTGVPFIVVQRSANAGAGTFNRLFADMGITSSASTYAHFDQTSIDTNVESFGDDESLDAITSLSRTPLFFIGSAGYTPDADAIATPIDDRDGDWYYCYCGPSVELHEEDVSPGIITTKTPYYQEGDTYIRKYDVSATILKPDDWEETLPAGDLSFTWWDEFTTQVEDRLVLKSAGLLATKATEAREATMSYAGTVYGGSRSYNVMVIRRATGAVEEYTSWDVHSSSGSTVVASQLADYLGQWDENYIIAIATWDEPLTNMKATSLRAALLNLGASPEILNYNMKYRGAYILVGIPGTVPGLGIERYAGSVAGSPDAYVTETLAFKENGCAEAETIIADTDGYPVALKLNGQLDNVVIEGRMQHYQNQYLDADAKALLTNIYADRQLSGKPKALLIASDAVGTGDDYSPMNTGSNGYSDMVAHLESLGWAISLHEMLAYTDVDPAWFYDYGAVLVLTTSSDSARVRGYLEAMMVGVRRGIGLHLLCLTPDLSPNAKYLMSYFSLTHYTANLDATANDLAVQYADHGSSVLSGLTAIQSSLTGGCFRQCLGLVPVAISTESWAVTGTKNSGRTITIKYSKELDRADSLKLFRGHGYAKLTDVRFSKIDMSGSDDYYCNMGYPAVQPLDSPEVTISDVSILETDGALLFATNQVSKLIEYYMEDPETGARIPAKYRTGRIISSYAEVLNLCGIYLYPASGTENSAPSYWQILRYKFNVRTDGVYRYKFSADNQGQVYIDGALIVSNNPNEDIYHNEIQSVLQLTAGEHTVEVRCYNEPDGGSSWTNNPTLIGFALHATFEPSLAEIIALGDKVVAKVEVSLSAPISGSSLYVDYASVDGTAKAGSDYAAVSGTLEFDKDSSSKYIEIEIYGDNLIESDEVFYVDIVPSRGTAIKSRGTVTITTDDVGVPGGSQLASGNDGVMWYPVEFGTATKVVVATLCSYTQPDRLDLFDAALNFLSSTNWENDAVIGNVNPVADYAAWVAQGSDATMALSQTLPKCSGVPSVFAPHYADDELGSAFYLRVEGAASTGWAAKTFIDELPIAARAAGGVPVEFDSSHFNVSGQLTLLDLSAVSNTAATFTITLARLPDYNFGNTYLHDQLSINLPENYMMGVDAGAKMVIKRRGVLVTETAYAAIGGTVSATVAYDPTIDDKYLEVYVIADPAASAANRGDFQTASTPQGAPTRLDWQCTVEVS